MRRSRARARRSRRDARPSSPGRPPEGPAGAQANRRPAAAGAWARAFALGRSMGKFAGGRAGTRAAWIGHLGRTALGRSSAEVAGVFRFLVWLSWLPLLDRS